MTNDPNSLCRGNAGDLHLGEGLAMAALAMCILATFLLEGDDLLSFALGEDLAGHRRARNQRRTMLGLVSAQHQDFLDLEVGTDVAGNLLDDQNVVLGHLVLFAAGADYREHLVKSLTMGNFREARLPREPRNILSELVGSRRCDRPAGQWPSGWVNPALSSASAI